MAEQEGETRRDEEKRTELSSHLQAVLLALFVTLLWSSSYVLITVGLAEIPALTFAGLRYALAAAILVVVFVLRGDPCRLRGLSGREWGQLVALGLLLYAVTQGAQFVALQSLRAATVSLVLTFTPAVVALLAVPLLDERPTPRQLAGLAVLFVGVGAYFFPLGLSEAAALGLAVMVVGLLGNSVAAVLGRGVNRDGSLSALGVTAVSMTIGSMFLLATGVTVQGLPRLSAESWAIVGWLAVVNTALAFTLWNRTLETLSAVESSVINNTMLVQVALLSWLFLGESLTALEIVGLVLVGGGALLVQLARA